MSHRWSSVLLLSSCIVAPPFVEGRQEESPAVAENDWPWWRGPRCDGSAPDGRKPPLSWSAEENVVWKASVPGRGHGSPTVSGGAVYLAACDEATGSQSVLCYDRGTGRQVW